MHAWLLSPDNFTPASRTPWGGTAIVSRYKSDLGLGPTVFVGESWEVSAGPEFPSRLLDEDIPLADLCARDPDYVLGEEAPRGGTSLLVKLLDAAANLSVQIHPADDYPGLAPDDCGKPESWYVLDADPGAGIYLGLAEGATLERMRTMLASGGEVSELLHFVEVEPGDFFVVDDGTAHAIGHGVTLIEPQVVRPGRRGVTYRYWDWNRRYGGVTRELHVDHALAVTNWERARGARFLREVRTRAGRPDLDAALRIRPLCGPSKSPVKSQHLDVARLEGNGALACPAYGRLRALTVVEGSVEIEGDGASIIVSRGRSAVIAARASVTLRTHGTHAIMSSAL